ncbi:MAG: hypothetical protein Q9181_005444 [Wetmoreana brouardii]
MHPPSRFSPFFRLYKPSREFHINSHKLHPRSKTIPPLRRSDEDDYYSLLLAQPLASTSPTAFSPPASPHPSTTKSQDSPRRDPSILFGTPLAGPSAARRRAGYGEEVGAAGGLERPREPDNCCMSGCVNCVWDAYREEVEAWAARRREVAKLAHDVLGEDEEGEEKKAREMRGRGKRMIGEEGDEVALFEGVPVGIREFMATEKRLRERREAEGREEG